MRLVNLTPSRTADWLFIYFYTISCYCVQDTYNVFIYYSVNIDNASVRDSYQILIALFSPVGFWGTILYCYVTTFT